MAAAHPLMRPSSATAVERGDPAFGARIKQARSDARLTQRELADRVGVQRRQLQSWEAGTTGITWEKLDRLAELLPCSKEWLIYGDELGRFPAREEPAEPAADVLRTIDQRLAHIEELLEGMAGETAGDPAGDATVAATRRVKRALTEDLEEPAGQETEAARRTRSEGDAPTGSSPARSAGTRRTGSKRAR